MSKLLRGVALFDEHLDEVLEMLVFNQEFTQETLKHVTATHGGDRLRRH